MENAYEIVMLLDFYGQLLTVRQYEIMDLHYNNDYSLAEIAEQLDISRQGVHDSIKKGKATLLELESKLALVKKFSEQREKAEEILEIVKQIDLTHLKEKDQKNIERIKEGIDAILQLE